MHRRTPPRGIPIHPRANSDWDELSNPELDSFELAEVRRKRNEKISRSATLAESANRQAEGLKQTLAQLQTNVDELRKETLKLRENHLTLSHTYSQLRDEVAELQEIRREGAKEMGAWKRQLVQSALSAVAIGISLAAVLSKC